MIAAYTNQDDDAILRRQEADLQLLLLVVYLECTRRISPVLAAVSQEAARDVIVELLREETPFTTIGPINDAVDVASAVCERLHETQRRQLWEALLFDDEALFRTVSDTVVSMIAHERAGMTAAAPSPFAVYAD